MSRIRYDHNQKDINELASPLVLNFRIEDIPSIIHNITYLLGVPSNEYLKKIVEEDGKTSIIDYHTDALKFNQTFFMKNSIKCLAASRLLGSELELLRDTAVLDVGGGIGNFALALSESGQWSNRIVIDRSPEQAALGRQLVDVASESYEVSWIVTDDIPTAWKPNSLALFSFSLCESPNLLISVLKRGWHTALMVDYPKIIDHCELLAWLIGARFVRKQALIVLCPSLAKAIGQTTISFDGAVLVYDSCNKLDF